ncbi:hypothetical protein ACIA5D_15220 [Actinoplanes sp. NPDC051513]|uniref:hypothetical protein n=1 Tax=Actinoplanes sp. NPDC051513 TaxID=3363908 RepID=UPI00378964F9
MAETISFRDSLRWTRDVLAQWRHWTRTHWKITLLLSVMAFLTGWVWNTYAMAVELEGSDVPADTRTTATADGHTLNAVFWLILFTLVSGLVTYAWTRGRAALQADVAALPRRFAEAMRTSRAGTLAMLLWGASVALVIATLIDSAVALALGLVLLALAATPVGVVLNFALIRIWRGLCGIIAPKAGARVAVMISPFLVMVGEGAGLAVDGLFGNWRIKALLGLAAAVVSVALARVAAPPRAATLLVVLATVVAWQVIRMRAAYADDGGWSECVTADGRTCSDLGLGAVLAWLHSAGAGHVLLRGSIGATFAAIGTLLGLGIGVALAGSLAAQAAGAGHTPRHGGDQPRRRSWPAGPDHEDRSWPPPQPDPAPPPATGRARPVPPPAEPDRPAGPRSFADPGRPADPSPPADPGRPADPSPPADPGRPADPSPPADPSRPADPSPPADPSRPADPSPPADPSRPADPSAPADPGRVYGSGTSGIGGQIYQSTYSGFHVPERPPPDPVVPDPPATGTAPVPRHGNPWADLDDFLPDPPERQARHRRRDPDDDPPPPSPPGRP